MILSVIINKRSTTRSGFIVHFIFIKKKQRMFNRTFIAAYRYNLKKTAHAYFERTYFSKSFGGKIQYI